MLAVVTSQGVTTTGRHCSCSLGKLDQMLRGKHELRLKSVLFFSGEVDCRRSVVKKKKKSQRRSLVLPEKKQQINPQVDSLLVMSTQCSLPTRLVTVAAHSKLCPDFGRDVSL